MAKIKIEGTWGITGIVSAIARIRAAGPNGLKLVNHVETGKWPTIIESVHTPPKYKQGKYTTQLPLKGFGGGATVSPNHPLGKGAIRMFINFAHMRTYLAKDGTTQSMNRELLLAHELGHCRAIQEGRQSDHLIHKLAIKYANPVFVELGRKERDETT